MKKEPRVYLEDILESIGKIEDYVRGLSFEQFERDTERQDAVSRRLEIIGEAVKRLSSDFKAQVPDIPWKEIAGMRDVLIHDYANVSLPRVWETATVKLTPLKVAVTEILNQKRVGINGG